MSHGHGAHADTENKKVAIFIAFIALLLAFAETFAKGAQTNQISYNVEASNLWAFYQAKTIRQTTLQTAADQMEVDVALAQSPATKKLLEDRVKAWRTTAARYQSEPKKNEKGEEAGEGRSELSKRAIAAGKLRDLYADKYHIFEIASAMFQVALVVTSVYLLTNAVMLLWASAALCAVGALLTVAGLFAPGLIHLIH
jgi:hypothetical protein